MAVAVSDVFWAMVACGFAEAIVTGVCELAAAQFLHWWSFFTAFFEIVSIVTNAFLIICKQRLPKTEAEVDCKMTLQRAEGWGTDGLRTECRGLWKRWEKKQAMVKRKLAAAWIELYLHHHVEWWIWERPWTAEGRSPREHCMARDVNWNYKQESILGWDHAGPLALLGGQSPLLQHFKSVNGTTILL